MKKIPFTYQLYFLRWLGTVPVVLFVYGIQRWLAKSAVSDTFYHILSLGMILAALGIYFICTETKPVFWQTGYCWEDDGDLYYQRSENAAPKKIEGVNEVFYWKSSVLSSKQANIQIKSDSINLKLHSIPMEETQKIEDMQLFNLYELVVDNTEGLIQEKDVFGNPIDYWYKKK